MNASYNHSSSSRVVRFLAALAFAATIFVDTLPDEPVLPANLLPPHETILVVVGPLGQDGDPDVKTMPAILRPRS